MLCAKSAATSGLWRVIGVLAAMLWATAARADDELFRRSVAPIFELHCVRCHQGEKPKGGLSLVERRFVLAGGESGPAIVPGKPDESLLLDNVSGDKPEMPKDGPKLTAAEVAVLRRWIAAGAPWPDGMLLTDKRPIDRHWWSLEPLAHPAVPTFAASDLKPLRRKRTSLKPNAIDAFILAKLRHQHLEPSPEADRRTLIRRLTYDLHGLPPTPAEIDAFAADPAPDAYERLVDRLLASPRYGERWGRHWLDIVHYGDTHGYDKDKPRPNAWPYRDYVIQAFNADKPYRRFIEEQLAGDVLFPDDPQGVVATGFVVSGPWDYVGHVELREGTVDKDIARSNDRDDMVALTASTFLSLTVHCARCHNHKFDPIAQTDYYRMQAVFAGVDRADRAYDPDGEKFRKRKKLLARERELKDNRDWLKSLGLFEPPVLAGGLAKVRSELAALGPPSMVFAAADDFPEFGDFRPAVPPRPVWLLARGDVRQHKELMDPGAVACVPGPSADLRISQPADEGQRRAALARWLADPANVLVRRSIVNRVWQYHFGQGIVDSPNDFGRMGSKPSHPELLEWLAGWFIEHGESIKSLDRLIVTSAAYRQVSADRPDCTKIDGDNRLLWRMNRTRLDAESVRDAMLYVDGRLDLTMGGPAVQQFMYTDEISPIYDYLRFDVDDPKSCRRGVYRFLVRSVPDPFMDCLDCADPSILTPKRNVTLTALQALALYNDRFALRQAEHLAQRVAGMSGETAGQIEAAYRLCLGRRPTAEESRLLKAHAAQFGMASVCRVILNSNEFLFID